MAKYFFLLNNFENSVLQKQKFDIDSYFKLASPIIEKKTNEVKSKLKNYPFPQKGEDVDLSIVTKDWFPEGKYQIFLSHSHNDKDTAIALAYYLKEQYGVECFIDSCVWGYMEDLLFRLDKEYCWDKEKNVYDYEKRNGTTAHVHLMLNTALLHMMDTTPVFLFLSTNNSLDIGRPGIQNWSYSSWIYSELSISYILSNKVKENSWKVLAESAQLPMGYSNIMTKHLKEVSLKQIQLNLDKTGNIDFDHLYKS